MLIQYAIHLCFVLQLGNTKTVDNKQTLYHFLADVVEKKHPDLLTLEEELIHVEKASRGRSLMHVNLHTYNVCVHIHTRACTVCACKHVCKHN